MNSYRPVTVNPREHPSTGNQRTCQTYREQKYEIDKLTKVNFSLRNQIFEERERYKSLSNEPVLNLNGPNPLSQKDLMAQIENMAQREKKIAQREKKVAEKEREITVAHKEKYAALKLKYNDLTEKLKSTQEKLHASKKENTQFKQAMADLARKLDRQQRSLADATLVIAKSSEENKKAAIFINGVEALLHVHKGEPHRQ